MENSYKTTQQIYEIFEKQVFREKYFKDRFSTNIQKIS